MKKAFVFSELVLICVVLALILAAAFPVMANLRSGGKTLSCAGNLAAIGKAVSLYNNEYGSFPRRGINAERRYGYNPAMTWVTLIVPYMGVKLEKPNMIPNDMYIKELICPDDVSPMIPNDVLYGQGGCSYVTNNMVSAGGRPQGGIAYGIPVNQIRRPSETFFAFDGANINGFITAVDQYSHSRIGYRHRFAGTANGVIKQWQEKLPGGVNVLFTDGHTGNQSGRPLTCKDASDVLQKNWRTR